MNDEYTNKESFFDLLSRACEIVNRDTRARKEKLGENGNCYICQKESKTVGYCQNCLVRHCAKCSTDKCGDDYWDGE